MAVLIQCRHNLHHVANVNVTFIEDIGRFTADVTIKCADCGAPFRSVSAGSRKRLCTR